MIFTIHFIRAEGGIIYDPGWDSIMIKESTIYNIYKEALNFDLDYKYNKG